ncbi:MAG: CDP-diacylglycerol--glycerol-3-phosphate 3-phosphatidyltransferase [Ignavibacteriaceae bacterium]|nr:CDP-diacylglycerol--glycerol-3-phosphate 3-phosphatidyltransferase [Ignavibacteriaceae bacterium]
MTLPNQLTILRIILTPVFVFYFFSEGEYSGEIALVIFLIAALTDWYDGWLARKFNYISAWGKFWDPIADKILTAGAFLSLVYKGVLLGWPVYLILLRDFLVTGFRAFAEYKGFTFPTSFYAKLKTLLQMVFLYYVLILYILLNATWTGEYKSVIEMLLDNTVITFLLLAIMAITLHSGADYFWQEKKVLSKLFKADK